MEQESVDPVHQEIKGRRRMTVNILGGSSWCGCELITLPAHVHP
jgi:hypothetical protein